MSITEKSRTLLPDLIRWRRYLHQHPELGFNEYETQQYIMTELSNMGLEPNSMGGTGVVVDMGSGASGVAIRADIDALPLIEESQVDFQSERSGVMHACGHDGHTAMLLGVARLLADQWAKVPGRIRLLFQPAEERIPGGAQQLIAEGALDTIDHVVGLHLSSDIPTGFAGAVVGVQTANADSFSITIEGRGGHGSQPQSAIDPIVVAAHLILSLQTIVSRNVEPRHAAVVTVGTVASGSNFNIIAPRAVITGTVRTFNVEDRRLIKQRIRDLSYFTAQAYHAEARVEYQDGYPSIVNAVTETTIAHAVIRRVLGDPGLLPIEPSMVGEDFSYYQQRCPGTFVMLGCGNPAVGADYPHHHPRFTLDEDALPLGTAILAESALEFLLINPKTVPKEGVS